MLLSFLFYVHRENVLRLHMYFCNTSMHPDHTFSFCKHVQFLFLPRRQSTFCILQSQRLQSFSARVSHNETCVPVSSTVRHLVTFLFSLSSLVCSMSLTEKRFFLDDASPILLLSHAELNFDVLHYITCYRRLSIHI